MKLNWITFWQIPNRILKRARDFAEVKSYGKINKNLASKALDKLGIDNNGLDSMDYKILYALVQNFQGGPVGLDSIGVAISENPRTVEEVYEPYLIKEGYIQRTSRGRVVTPEAEKYYLLASNITVEKWSK